MMAGRIGGDRRFQELLGRLGRMSVDTYYNPYRLFQWPEALSTDEYWMPPDLLSVHGTDLMDDLPQETLVRLSHTESIGFYSLNIHGIRELLVEVVGRIHTHGFEVPSSFFHHFIGEENEHMWFFATFCQKYGGRIYPAPRIKVDRPTDPEVEHFLVFARILVFEEIVDFYNLRMARDRSLPDTVREVNRIHHRDESRHIAFGRELVRLLHEQLRERHDAQVLREVEDYVKRYMVSSLQSFYNPLAYRDAGLSDGFALRQRLVAHPSRDPFHQRVLERSLGFLVKSGILSDPCLPTA